MVYLSEKIIAYLTVNNISFTAEDYFTAQPEGQPDQIIYWNAEKLGAVPTDEQLDSAWVIYSGEQAKAANKAQATSLLTATDWTTIPDVSDPALSDPYLTNASEFAAYRSQIRKIAVNPPVTVDVWPIEPEEVWAYTDA